MTSTIGSTLTTNAQLHRENTDLKRENELANQVRNKVQALQSENSHLRKLLALPDQPKIKSVAAEILYAARDIFTQKIIAGKGARQNILPGQAVVDNIGLIGQVTRVHWLSSEINLITDKGHMVPIQIARNGLRGVVFGTGQKNSMELRFLPINTDIQNGDMLVTSGIGGNYPTGLPVATVTTIERNDAFAFAKILCAPAAGTNHYKQVLILSFAHQTSTNALKAQPQNKKMKAADEN